VNDRQHDFQAKELVENLPLLPGVYRFLDVKGEVLYVGKAKQLKKHVASYFQKINVYLHSNQ
jgi:excinuclease ABC subunit C